MHIQHNGFLPEVSRCFRDGFPSNWDKYANEDYENKSISTAIIPNSSQTNEGVFPILNLENTFNSISLIADDVSALSSKEHNLLEKSSAEKYSGTRKMTLLPETSFESPRACVKRNSDNVRNLNSGVKVGSFAQSPDIKSLLHINHMRKLGDYKLSGRFRAQRIRVHSSIDDSHVLEARKDGQKEDTILLETSLKISPNGKESKRNDANTINSGALDDSHLELGRNRECRYSLRSRNATHELGRNRLQITNEKESQERSIHAELPRKLHGNPSENLQGAPVVKDEARKKRKWKPIQKHSILEQHDNSAESLLESSSHPPEEKIRKYRTKKRLTPATFLQSQNTEVYERKKKKWWTTEEVDIFKKAVERCGVGNWALIK